MIDEAKNPEYNRDYLARLKNLGIETLGRGLHAEVFQHPTMPDVVVKMFDATDRAYMHWLRTIVRIQNNKYVPKIIPTVNGKFVHRYLRHGSSASTIPTSTAHKYYFIFMRRYDPISREQIAEFSDYIVSTMPEVRGVHAMRLRDSIKQYQYIPKYAESWKLIADYSTDPELRQIAEILYKADNNYVIDLHEGNIMWDSKLKTVIFTDPLR
jgi:hypothetical protein